MPADTLTQVRDMAVAAAVVLAVAAPVVVGGAVVARWLGRRVLPRWRPTHTPWTGFDIVFLFVWQQVLTISAMGALDAAGFFRLVYGAEYTPAEPKTIEALWGRSVAVLWLLLTAWAVRTLVHGDRWVPAVAELPGRLALGAVAWVVVTPAVFAVHFVAVVTARQFGAEPDQHSLTRLGVGTGLFDQVFFGVAVCLATPLEEEFVFRGLMVRWAAGRRYRPWTLMAVAGLAALMPALSGKAVAAPVTFVAVLAVGLYLLVEYARTVRPRFPVRTGAAVYASAAVFAAAHSAVWPTPVPLFVLGLALGYLAVRTGGIAACVALHGLFNAVTFTYLLRGGT